jgi:PilZ domain
MTSEERRRSPRQTVKVPAVLSVRGEARSATLRDVCRDAALVETDRWEPLGTEVTLALALPGASGPLELSGTVIRLAPGEQGTHGMAVLFSSPSPEAEARIDAFVAGRDG